MQPVFRKTKKGKLSLADTCEAFAVRSEHRERAYCKPLAASLVRSRAEAAVRRLHGDIDNKAHLLGQFTIQFGQFRGETFQWLASNALGYAAAIVASSETDPKAADARWVNKMALKNYLGLFPEGLEAVQTKKTEKQGLQAPAQPVTAATDVLSDTDDQELSAMAEKIEHDLAASQQITEQHTPAVLQSPASDEQPSEQSSSEKSPGTVQKKKQVRSVSGAPMKTVRSLFLGQSASSAGEQSRPSATSSTSACTTSVIPSTSSTTTEQLMVLTPVHRGQPSSASEVPLLKKWRTTLPSVDHIWVSSALFYKDHLGDSRLDFSRISGLWLHPPQAPLIPRSAPKLYHFFGHRVFFWMPVKLWSLKVSCPHSDCNNPELSYAGVYQVVRQVLDVSSFYNLVSETLSCKRCKKKMVSWSHNILSQIDVGHRSMFPCLLTTMKACDMKVAILLRQRGLGNSASQVQKKLQEQHSTEWYQRTIQYLSACKSITSAASSGLIEQQTFCEPPAMTPVPQYRWLMQVYIQDVLQRLDEVKASITSVFGRILKVDSTKKVTKKLTGPTSGTAEWATNVGNEYGQVLMSVMTSGEGRFGLHRMAKGLMKRFSDAKQPPPEVIYIDRDCCGRSNILNLFDKWQDVEVRLDVWHFMRRLSAGCHTDSHPLYGLFMQKMSRCIFAWDNDDLHALKAAKRSELLARHVSNPSEDLVMRSITKRELALHCRRTTRGVEETLQLIEDLIHAFDGDKGKDTLGVPLLNSRRMREEWDSQKQHIACLQDPQGVQLYIQTGTLKKGGRVLPTYRCCRGSTSLESFHLHLNRFIPGTLANDTVFQAYLVDGLSRWNQDRASAATGTKEPQSYSGLLRFTANQLTEDVFKQKLSSYTPPRKYTGELIGIEYLYDQTGRPLQEYDAAIQQMEDSGLDVPKEDEGFIETEEEDLTIPTLIVEEETLNVRVQSEPRLGSSPAAVKEQSKRQAPVIEQPSMATKVRVQSEPCLGSSPAAVKEQSKRQAPVIEQPSMATKVRVQSEPCLGWSPAAIMEQSKRQAPVIEQPSMATTVRVQSESCLGSSPAAVKEQSKRQAPVIEQPSMATKVRVQSESCLGSSPAAVKEQSKRQAPVIEQPSMATTVRVQSESCLGSSPAAVKEQSKRQAPVIEQPSMATTVRVQSEPCLGSSPAAVKEQSKRQAPVIEQPSMATKVRVQSEPRLEPSPVTRTHKEQLKPRVPVIQRPPKANQGEQFEPLSEQSPATTRQILQYTTDAEQEEQHDAQDYDDSVGPDNIPGYGRVQALAAYLVKLQTDDLFLTTSQAGHVVKLWTSLNDYDKRPIVFSQVYTQQSRGRFRAKRHAAPGVESTERSMMGPDSVPAARPDCNRYVEAVVHRLCVAFPGSRRRDGQVWSRWSVILEAYSKIRTTILSSASVMQETTIQLPDISQKTLKAWHNDKAREVSRQVLYQGINLPEASITAPDPLPAPKQCPTALPRGDGDLFRFSLPTDTAGTVAQQFKRRRLPPPVSTPSFQETEPIYFATPLTTTTTTTTATTTTTSITSVSVPYTTFRYRKRKFEEESLGRHRRTYTKTKLNKNCKKCGHIISKPTHVNYFGNLYCQNSETTTFEEWKEQFKDRNYGKKKGI